MRGNKRSVFVGIALAAIILCVALANMHYISTPRLIIKFAGQPAGNATLVLPNDGNGPYQLDDQGSITAPSLSWNQWILVPRPDGGGVSVSFPRHGTKVVDFRGRITTTTTVQYFGLVSRQSESFSYTGAEVAGIESGRKTSAEIQEQIRQSERE